MSPNNISKKSVAVIGGGIGGISAAWTLHRSGFDVQVFERANAIGGNARTFSWKLPEGVTAPAAVEGEAETNRVETGIFVLAWPTNFYHTYNQLLDLLGVESEVMPIKYFVTHPSGTFAQDGAPDPELRLDDQFERWNRLIRFVEKANRLFTPSLRKLKHDSLYHISYLNPMNFVPLYALARLFGITRTFWERIFVGVHSATFITTKMTDIPAVILPLLEGVVPLEHPTAMSTWRRAPRDVFDRLIDGFRDKVHTGHRITRVEQLPGGGFRIADEKGRSYQADQVVFACNAKDALAALDSPSPLERMLLGNVDYVDDQDPTFQRAVLHTDTSVLPAEHRERILGDFNTYTDIGRDGRVECTFVLSSHLPITRGLGQPLLVTFNSRKPIDPQKIQGNVAIPRCNHSLNLKNLSIVALMRLIQGRRGVWYCGGFTTPEGGHDLSLLSGMVVARAMGAHYPLDPSRVEAVHDFRMLEGLMLGRNTPLQAEVSIRGDVPYTAAGHAIH